MQIEALEPKVLWNHFTNLNAVPRPSKKEEKVIAFIKAFGEGLKLETEVDQVGNVLIKKPASKGMENRKTVVLQSHIDMVHQKNEETIFDFDTQGIEMFIEGDWVKAKGTTLGADNGIGVAAMMSILSSSDIVHPAIEALFTIDEETGMTGAFALESDWLKGEILLNLDTEDDRELTIGCAGGIDLTFSRSYEEIELPAGSQSIELSVKGLSGGHSGMDIHKGLGNANKIMNRFLYSLHQEIPFYIHKIEGGSLRNAIPRESIAQIAISEDKVKNLQQLFASFKAEVMAEYQETDPKLELSLTDINSNLKVANPSINKKLLNAIYAIPNGIIRMSPTMDDLVQTSNNLAQVNFKDGELAILCLCRSAVDTEKMDAVRSIKAAALILDAKVEAGGSYPGWKPKLDSQIVSIMAELYKSKFNEEPMIMAGHGGLECGIIGGQYPNLDMVSFGPNIRGAHSPDERVQISSVQKFWSYFLDTLKAIPLKN